MISAPIGRDELGARVRSLREAIARRAAPDPELDALSDELHRLLIAPAEPLLESATRLLISPDGPLHVLPFGALRPAGANGSSSPFLIERWPLHFVISATVYGELRSRDPPPHQTMLAFGDPEEGVSELAGETLRAYLGSVAELEPLPWARREVLALESLFESRAEVFLGRRASEHRVKTLAPQAGYLHFATHGLLSERFPMSSALRLAATEEPLEAEGVHPENGLLEAWEVVEQLRLDARLVTLSSCESALGRELGGEGLVGLTRAFQFAGARSVLASIWQVADQATSALMHEAYGRIARGEKHLDQALQHAQLALIEGRAVGDPSAVEATRAVGGLSHNSAPWRHPFYWAGFQLYGDR